MFVSTESVASSLPRVDVIIPIGSNQTTPLRKLEPSLLAGEKDFQKSGSVQHHLAQLPFPEGPDEVVGSCCVVWNPDCDVSYGET